MKVREKELFDAYCYEGSAQELAAIDRKFKNFIAEPGRLTDGQRLNVGDFIIVLSNGAIEVLSPTVFEAVFERVPETFLQMVQQFTEDMKRFPT